MISKGKKKGVELGLQTFVCDQQKQWVEKFSMSLQKNNRS